MKYRLELDMRYGNQLLTQAVTLDVNRMKGVGDVLHMIRTFGDVLRPPLRRQLRGPRGGDPGRHRPRRVVRRR